MSEIKLKPTGGGAGSVSLKAPAATTSNADVPFVLPVADGSAGQYLKTDGSKNLSFAEAGGNTVKLSSQTISSSVAGVTFDGLFDDSTYACYMLQLLGVSGTNDSSSSAIKLRMQSSSGTDYTSSNYQNVNFDHFRNSSTHNHGSGGAFNTDFFDMSWNNLGSATAQAMIGYAYFYFPQSTTYNLTYMCENVSTYNTPAYYRTSIGGTINDASQAFTGFKIYPTGGSLDAGTIILYGVKK